MVRSKFFQFFPPPQFLQMKAVGLDISDVSLRFVELIETKQGMEIGRFGERAIPRGVIEGGEVKKPSDLRAILSEVKKEYNLEFVAVSLPEEKAYLFDLRLPQTGKSNIRGAIELALEERVPLKASEALFDYQIEKESDTTMYVNVSVVPRALIDGYLEAFSMSGIIPVAFEIEAQSVTRAIIPDEDNRASMIVDFGRTRTGITIVEGGMVEFTSTVPVGGGALTEAIMKKMNISYDEAEKIKHEKGITSKEGNEDLSLALVSAISVLRDEIAKLYAYWQKRDDTHDAKHMGINKIYLCGGDSNLAGFVEYLTTGLDISVDVGLANIFVNMNSLNNYVPTISFSDSLSYATAIGLALRCQQ
ncbi:MAG: pilus assembly protein PilM [Candidatus Yonathbacteria bacterium]|nr:pilus assembly protein PilM [Candidatus Yonathbacteria bacterium]